MKLLINKVSFARARIELTTVALHPYAPLPRRPQTLIYNSNNCSRMEMIMVNRELPKDFLTELYKWALECKYSASFKYVKI